MIRSIQRMCIIARVVIFSVYCVSGTSNVFFPLKWSTINSHLLELFARRQHIRVYVCFNNLQPQQGFYSLNTFCLLLAVDAGICLHKAEVSGKSGRNVTTFSSR